ncbi:MAG: nitrogenase [Opitutae bacterium]|nr:nitrogenase [Opitutae bacterium]
MSDAAPASIRTPVAPGADSDEFPGPTTNACKLCTPLGACLAYKGIAGTVPFLHGSQGCATYIRRYLISHFREPLDIAASNFAEHAAVFGGREVLHTGLANVTRQYRPELIGIATTCLSETIGENLPQLLREYREQAPAATDAPALVHVSTPSYRGTHVDGFHATVRALVETLAPAQIAAPKDQNPGPVALFPGFVSAADLRHLRELVAAFGLTATLVPDYSETMDGASWCTYEPIPAGGTPVAALRALGAARAAIECGRILAGEARTAGTHLAQLGVPLHRLGLPIGLRETDRFCYALELAAGLERPASLALARGRLLDAMVDGHKYVFNQRALVFGDEDFVIGLTSFLCEIGMRPVLCASGGRSRRFGAVLRAAVPELPADTIIREGADYADIEAAAMGLQPDLLLGPSKGYALARRLGVPLVRCGFPVHDRLGGHRLLHVGYAGALQLYDTLVNALLERKQASSPVGYSYL